MKGYTTAWIVSLLVIAGIVILYTILSMGKIVIPDAWIRVFGVLDLIAIAVLFYSTVKLRAGKKEKKNADRK